MIETTVGIAGCGRMGLPMARALQRGGVDVYGFDVRTAAAFGDFADRMIADPREFARRCRVVFTVVRDQRQTDDLLFDDQALLAGPNGISTLVVSSTLSPRYLHALRARVPANIDMADAPMSGAAWTRPRRPGAGPSTGPARSIRHTGEAGTDTAAAVAAPGRPTIRRATGSSSWC